MQVGGEDFHIDLLFFHRGLQCLVAFKLKIGKFKPEYISKMDFYLEALDCQKKKENENLSVGMVLCASEDDEVVEYAMSKTLSPMMVAEYKLQLPDKAVLQKKVVGIDQYAADRRIIFIVLLRVHFEYNFYASQNRGRKYGEYGNEKQRERYHKN